MDDYDTQLRQAAECALKNALLAAGAPNPCETVDSLMKLNDAELRSFLVIASRLLPRAAVHDLGVEIIHRQPLPDEETTERVLAIAREIFGEATAVPNEEVIIEGWPHVAVQVNVTFEEALDKADQWHRRILALGLPTYDKMAFIIDKNIVDDD